MQFVHDDFDPTEIEILPRRGALVEEYLIYIEADFRIVDADRVIYSEVRFPVAELAWALGRSGPVTTEVVDACVRDFIGSVEEYLVAHGFDADLILGGVAEPVTPQPQWICPCGSGPVVVAERRSGGQVNAMCRVCVGIYADLDASGGVIGSILEDPIDPD